MVYQKHCDENVNKVGLAVIAETTTCEIFVDLIDHSAV
jgi:hypothetical protein